MKKRFKFKKLRLNFFRAGALSKSKSALLFFSVALVLTFWLTWAILSTDKNSDKKALVNNQKVSIQKIESNLNEESYKAITVNVNSADLLSPNASENETLIINNDVVEIKSLDLPWAAIETIPQELETLETLETKTILKDDSSIAQAGTLLFQKEIQKENQEQIKKEEIIVPQKTKTAEQKVSSNKNTKANTNNKKINTTSKKTEAQTYSVQLGSFLSKNNADELVSKLKNSGETAFIIKGIVDNKTWFRVMSGKFDSQKKAKEHEKQLISKKIISRDEAGRIKKLT